MPPSRGGTRSLPARSLPVPKRGSEARAPAGLNADGTAVHTRSGHRACFHRLVVGVLTTEVSDTVSTPVSAKPVSSYLAFPQWTEEEPRLVGIPHCRAAVSATIQRPVGCQDWWLSRTAGGRHLVAEEPGNQAQALGHRQVGRPRVGDVVHGHGGLDGIGGGKHDLPGAVG